MSIAYLNGEFLPRAEARVPAMDRGYLFGDGVYEVIPVYGNKLFRLPQHLQRLANSLNNIQLDVAIDEAHWRNLLETLLAHNAPMANATIYLQITRGPAADRKLSFPANSQPTIFAYCSPLVEQTIAAMAEGISVITLNDIRWQQCNTKAITLLGNVLLRQQATEQQADEAILIRAGHAVEGTASNLFIVKQETMITPPLTGELLGGITRQLVLELAAAEQVPHELREITVDELTTADEIWLTSTSREIAPVTRLNKQPVNTGQAGPLWRKMIACFQAYKTAFAAGRVE